MAKQKRFLQIVESHMNRHSRGGFLVGDVFVFKGDFKSTPCYKNLGKATKEAIADMVESGLHLRVINIKDSEPGARYPADGQTASNSVNLELACDQGGGRWWNPITVPSYLGDPDDEIYPNLPPIPDGMKYDVKVNIKPQELEQDEENLSNKTDRGDGKLSPTEIKSPFKDTKIPSKPVSPCPTKSSTVDYMAGVKKR